MVLVMKIERRALLVELLTRRRETSAIVHELAKLPWDSPSLVHLERRHLRATLQALLRGEMTPGEVEEWANAIECREDIALPAEADTEAMQVLWEPANPDLSTAIDDSTAQRLLARLT